MDIQLQGAQDFTDAREEPELIGCPHFQEGITGQGMVIDEDFGRALGKKAVAWITMAQPEMRITFAFPFNNSPQAGGQILIGLRCLRKGVTVVDYQESINSATIFAGVDARVDDVQGLAIQCPGNLLK